jgi:hypothetical protein
VVQYLSPAELDRLLPLWRRKLAPAGMLVIADVVDPDAGMLPDVLALLRLARAEGFLLAALGGLAATFLSDYRRLRRELGLALYREGEMLARLRAAGYAAERRPRNLGFNQARMTFLARPDG